MIPPGYAVRPANRSDLDAVTRVSVACDMLDWGSAAVEAQDILDDWDRPSFDLERDSVVVATEEAGQVVGYGFVATEGDPVELEGWGAVDPDHQGRGIGALLIERMEAIAGVHAARADGAVLLRMVVASVNTAAAELVQAHGYAPVRSWWHMEADLEAGSEPGPAPDGIRIEPFRAGGDDERIYSVIEESFAEHWGFSPTPYDEWRRQHLERGSLDPSLWFLAWDDDRVAGAITAGMRLEMGWIGELGVLKPWRGRGIAAALLRRTFAEMAARRYGRVGLNVDAQNTTGATALYEKVGMRVMKRFDVSEKEIRPGRSTTA
ncbi:MAG: GNAT family N-acetyltransferase [Actinomycetota bacterium]